MLTVQQLLIPYSIALCALVLFRYARPIKGQSVAFVIVSSMAGAAVGIFAGLLIGGASMADDPYWLYLACPLIAFALTARLQVLAIEWIRPDES